MAEPKTKCPRIDLLESSSSCITDLSSAVEFLTEKEVGIMNYVKPDVAGFICTLKSRWEDFVVKEISHGLLAELTDVTPISDNVDSGLLSEYSKVLKPYASKLEALLEDKNSVLRIDASIDKTERTLLHKAIRHDFPSLVSNTVKEADRTQIIVGRSDCKDVSSHFSKRAFYALPKDRPFCRFILYKEGKDTLNAIQLLSHYLNVPPVAFGYAGTKDRRAITTQFVTIKNITSKRLSELNRCLRGMCVGNFAYVSSPLFLGDLEGNHFIIVLRSVSACDKTIQEAVASWKTYGFINYYGLQRFGHSVRIKSFEIGRHLIRCEWSKAIDIILTPTPSDLPQLREAKQNFLAHGDASIAASLSPPGFEKTLLLGIARHGKTLNALQMLPRNLRQLYVHSYQSFLWNRVASRRAGACGLKELCAQVGDLYLPNADIAAQDYDLEESESLELSEPTGKNRDRTPLPSPKIVTERDTSSTPVTDVVLPLPGFTVRYPENDIGAYYSELLSTDQLTMDDLRHRVRDFALPGSYRSLIVKPRDVSFEIRSYTDPNIPLVPSDLQKLRANDGAKIIPDSTVHLDEEPSEPSGRAVILRFTLPKSSYATMAIRELTKSFTEIR